MDGALISSCFFLLPTVCPDRSLESGVLPNDVSPFIPFSKTLGVLSCFLSFSLVDPGLDVIRRAGWRRCWEVEPPSRSIFQVPSSRRLFAWPFRSIRHSSNGDAYSGIPCGSSRASLVAGFLSSVAVHFYLLSPHFRMLVSLRGRWWGG